MTTTNIKINGEWSKVTGQLFSNPNMSSLEYIILETGSPVPSPTITGTVLSYKSPLDLREFQGKDIYFRTINKLELILVVMTGIPESSSGGGSGGLSSDRELVVTTYSVKTAFVGASVGDTITQTQVIDVSAAAATVGVIWRNQSTDTDLLSTPLASNLSLVGVGSALTNTQLRSQDLNVNVTNTEIEVKNAQGASLDVNITNEIEIKNDAGNPLITKTAGLVYPTSTLNSSTLQIPAGSNFTGTPETIMELQAAQVQIVCDQPYRVEIFQYIDEAGTKQTSVDSFTRAANVPLNENITLPGNYFKLKVTNLGTSATTKFEVNTTFGIMNTQPRALTNNGNFPVAIQEGMVTIKGVYDRWRDSFKKDDETLWTKSIDVNDGYNIRGSTQGAGYGQLSKSALTNNTTSKLISKNQFSMPVRLGYGMSLSQRIHGEVYTIDMVSVDPISGLELVNETEDNLDIVDTKSVSLLYVTSNIATVMFTTNHNFKYGDIVVISGATDTRINVLGRISSIVNKRCIQIPITIANATYVIGANCVMSIVNISNGNGNIAGFGYLDTTTAHALYYHRAQGSGIFTSPNTSFGTAYTDVLIPSSQPYTFNLQPRFASEILAGIDVLRFGANPIDNASVGTYVKRTQVVPSVDAKYAMRVRGTTLPNKAIPLEINTAVKTGTTTATVTTVLPHGLSTGAYVRCYGSSNQTIWPNVTTETVITVTGTNTFTIVWGTAVTNTLYGGFVIPVNGTGSITGAVNIGMTGSTWANGRLFVGTTATPSLTVGDTVRLISVKDSTGVIRNNLSDRYRVYAITPNILESAIQTGANTTNASAVITLTDTSAAVIGAIVIGTGIPAGATIVSKVDNVSITISANATVTGNTWLTITGMVLEPLEVNAPANEQPTLPISAGGIIKETDLRINFVRCLDYTRTPVEITGGHSTNDQQLAAPVSIMNSINAVVTQATASNLNAQVVGPQANGTALTVNPVVIGGKSTSNLVRPILVDESGAISGPGEVTYGTWIFTAGSATPAEGTNSRTVQAPLGRDCDLYVGIAVQGNAANTMQIEGSYDNVNFSVIPMQRSDNFAANNQYQALATWIPSSNATYKGKTYGYPYIRIHQTALTTTGTTVGAVRIVPMATIPGETTSPFSLSTVSTVEAVGTSAGALQAGGVRTVMVPFEGASKVTLILDALTYATAVPTSSSLVVEGTCDNTTWYPIALQPLQGGSTVTSITGLGALNQWYSGVWEGEVGSYIAVRVRRSATVLGTSTNVYYHGALKITPSAIGVIGNSNKSSYRFTTNSVSVNVANYILAAIESSATKTIRLKRIIIWHSGTTTTSQFTNFDIYRTTAASTGGTVVTPGPQGINDPAASAIVKVGNPTVTSTYTYSLWNATLVTPSVVSQMQPVIFDFTAENTLKGIEILPGTANGVCFRVLNTAGANLQYLTYSIEFTEE